MNRWIKIWFESKEYGKTARLIIPKKTFETKNIAELSRMFPYSEALKMRRFFRSPEFDTWQDAFYWEERN